jgi:hypothetical protein
LQRALACIRRTEPAGELLAPCPRFEFHPRRFVCDGVEVRVVPIERHLLKDTRFGRPPVAQLERFVRRSRFDVMAQFAVNGFVIDPAKIQLRQRGAPPGLSLGQREGRQIQHFVQNVEDMAVGFARYFPGVERFSAGRNLHRFGKARGTGLHAFLEAGQLVRQSVFALGAVFGQLRRFAIALKAQTDASSIFGGHQHVSPKFCLDLGLLLVALRSALKCIAVDQVISGVKIVAPGGCRLGGTYRRPTDKDKKADGDSDNRRGQKRGCPTHSRFLRMSGNVAISTEVSGMAGRESP